MPVASTPWSHNIVLPSLLINAYLQNTLWSHNVKEPNSQNKCLIANNQWCCNNKNYLLDIKMPACGLANIIIPPRHDKYLLVSNMWSHSIVLPRLRP